MKSSWFGSPARYEFAKCLAAADRSMHSYELFGGFLTCASGAFEQGVRRFRGLDLCPDIESSVIAAQSRVKHPECYAKCLALLVDALESEPGDFLGSMLMELGQHDVAYRGQCFTPVAVSRAMAEMTLHDISPDPNHRLSIQEPACGGGSMVIAASMYLQSRGFFPWHYYWVCVDVDWRCWAMTFIQCTLLGIPASVVHGNTLSLEITKSTDTIALAMHPVREKRTAPSVAPDSASSESNIEPSTLQTGPATQLTFGFE